MTNEIDLGRLRDLLEKATPGPWEEVPGERGHIVSGLMADPECDGATIYDWNIATVHGPFSNRPTELFDGTHNAALIALTPTLARAYLAAMEENARLSTRVSQEVNQHMALGDAFQIERSRATAAEQRAEAAEKALGEIERIANATGEWSLKPLGNRMASILALAQKGLGL